MPAEIRPATTDDHKTILELNNDAVPAVSTATRGELDRLIDQAHAVWVAERDHVVVGFLILMTGPGLDYESLNYRWFSERYSSFLYVDRIVISPVAQGEGLGSRIYEAVFEHGAGRWPVLNAEVNTRPRNEQSLAFHDRLGFVEVGQQDTEGGTKRVSLLSRPLR